MPTVSELMAQNISNAETNVKTWNALGYNVLEYGVIGDGITDDTAALQALVDMAIAAGRKTIMFPHTPTGGQYKVTALTNDDQVDFVGENCSFIGGYTGTIGDLAGYADLQAELVAHIAEKATETDLGHVKVDGTTITIDDDGVISARASESINIKYPPPPLVAAKGDGTTDDTSAIQGGIAYLKSQGGGTLFLPNGVYKVTSKTTIDAKCVVIKGAGADSNHDVGAIGGSTVIKWAGAVGGTMFEFVPVEGVDKQKLARSGLQNLTIAGEDIAGVGLSLKSLYFCDFSNLTLLNFKDAAIDLGVVSSLGEPRDSQRNTFKNISIRQLESSNGVGIKLSGDSSANCSYNEFQNIDIAHKNGTAIDLYQSDNNFFMDIRINRASGGTGKGIIFNASTTAGGAAYSNFFVHASPGNGGIVSKADKTYPAMSNQVLFHGLGNGEPYPVVESGSSLSYTTELGESYNFGFTKAGFGDTSASARAAQGTARTGSHTAVFQSGVGAGALFTDGTNSWLVRVYNSGQFEFIRVSGTGSMALPIDLSVGSKQVTFGANDSGGTGYKVLRVPN